MARLAVVLHEGSLAEQQVRLGRILDFFGVPWKSAGASSLADPEFDAQEHVIFGTAQTIAAALRRAGQTNRGPSPPAAFYVYLDDNLSASEQGLREICGGEGLALKKAPGGELPIRVSSKLAEFTGAMSGVEVRTRLRAEDAILAPGVADGESRYGTVISAGSAPVFIRFERNGVPVFFCASSHMLDVDQPISAGFFDVKDHFCSVVPLVTFIRHMFQEVAWGPQELGACLIIDDPLLALRYGHCDFRKLRDQMRRYAFTTNIAFIPWNWRRTSRTGSDFFSRESQHFSVSIHGCDHTVREFGTTSLELLHNRAKLAQARMQNHQARTGIRHDAVMVFPQGVFSSVSPEALKLNGYLAAVNTEILPVDSDGKRTRIRDVWDIAIMSYSGFPIFTRRYPRHGLENFAFDLLLGKPCLIVSHHDLFKDDAPVIDFIVKLQALNSRLSWRPLGDVVRRACRRRSNGAGAQAVEMYGSELILENPSDKVIEVSVRKREEQPQAVAELWWDQEPAKWAAEAGQLVFAGDIPPHSESRLRVRYLEHPAAGSTGRSLRFELAVATRRMLSEFRDNYLSRGGLLSPAVVNLVNAITKSH